MQGDPQSIDDIYSSAKSALDTTINSVDAWVLSVKDVDRFLAFNYAKNLKHHLEQAEQNLFRLTLFQIFPEE